MPFVNGGLFLGGLGLIAVPIIIHLITRRRFRRLEWAAMEYLLEALRRNRRRIRLEQLLLLALRILLIALIVTALARPHLSQESFGWLGKSFLSEEKVFVIDDSLSMGHVESGRRSLDRASEAVLVALEKTARDGGNDPVTIIRTSRYKVPLQSAVTVDRNRLETIREELQGRTLFPTALRMDLTATLEDLASSAHAERARSITILSDFCQSDWTDGKNKGPREALERALEHVRGPDENPTRLVLVDVGARSRSNVAVTDFALETPSPVIGLPAELGVGVSNFGRDTVRGVGIRFRTKTSLIPGPRIASIPRGETVELRVPHVFSEVGPSWIRVEVDTAVDGLGADDGRDLVVEVFENIEVLLVDGEPSAEFGDGETDFLVQAVRPRGELTSGYLPTAVVESNLPLEELDKFAVVFLANVASISEELATALEDYVSRGGGLVIFGGDRVNPNAYERTLGPGSPQKPGADLLPALLGDIRGDPNQPVHIDPTFDHPVFRALSGGGEILFRLVEVGHFVNLTAHPDARVVARLSDEARSPFLVERRFGKGKTAIFSVPPDLEWSSWPRNATFLPVIHELLGWIGRSMGSGSTQLAGTAIEIPIDIVRFQQEAKLRLPDYPASPESRLLATAGAVAAEGKSDASASTLFRFRQDDTRKSGLYTFTLRSLDGEELTRLHAVNADPDESDLTRVDPGELQELYPAVEFTVVSDPSGLGQSRRGRFEIADLLLGLFLIVLLLEGTLAWWFAHHRQPGDGPVRTGLPTRGRGLS